MKHATAWLATLVLAATPLKAEQGAPMTKDQTAALSAIETMTEAFMAGDIDTVMASYEPTASVLFEPGAPVTDPQALAEMFKAMSMARPVFDYAHGHEVVVVGDIALHIAPWSMTATAPDGTSLAQSGLSVAVLRKQPDGAWKMVIDNPHGARLMPNP